MVRVVGVVIFAGAEAIERTVAALVPPLLCDEGAREETNWGSTATVGKEWWESSPKPSSPTETASASGSAQAPAPVVACIQSESMLWESMPWDHTEA
eukprot:8108392-Alexandrium_andersonii.AAC.1